MSFQMRLRLQVNGTLAPSPSCQTTGATFDTIEELLATGRAVGNEACIICLLQDVGGPRALGELVAHVLLVVNGISKSGHH